MSTIKPIFGRWTASCAQALAEIDTEGCILDKWKRSSEVGVGSQGTSRHRDGHMWVKSKHVLVLLITVLDVNMGSEERNKPQPSAHHAGESWSELRHSKALSYLGGQRRNLTSHSIIANVNVRNLGVIIQNRNRLQSFQIPCKKNLKTLPDVIEGRGLGEQGQELTVVACNVRSDPACPQSQAVGTGRLTR